MFSISKLLLVVIFCISAAQGVAIKCVFSVTYWESVGFCYHCRATIINTSNSTELNGVQGNHLWGQGNKQVLSFSIAGQNAPRILKNIDNFFPNLIALDWFNTNLQVISAGDLKQFTKLKVLSVSNNKLTTLEGNLFSNSKKLQSIYFNNNSQLKVVGPEIFSGLSDLTHAEFLNGGCINTKAIGAANVKKLGEQLPKACPIPVTTTTTQETTTQRTTTTTQRSSTTQRPTTERTTTTQRPTTERRTTQRPTTERTTSTQRPTSERTTTTQRPTTERTTTTQRPTTTTESTTPLKTTTTTSPTTTRPVIDCSSISGVAPHPTDCTKYYECVRGVMYERTCPEGKKFDIYNMRCESMETAVCAI